MSNPKSRRGDKKKQKQGGVQGERPEDQSPKRREAEYQHGQRPKPDKHGGSGAGRQQGGSGAGRERG